MTKPRYKFVTAVRNVSISVLNAIEQVSYTMRVEGSRTIYWFRTPAGEEGIAVRSNGHVMFLQLL